MASYYMMDNHLLAQAILLDGQLLYDKWAILLDGQLLYDG